MLKRGSISVYALVTFHPRYELVLKFPRDNNMHVAMATGRKEVEVHRGRNEDITAYGNVAASIVRTNVCSSGQAKKETTAQRPNKY